MCLPGASTSLRAACRLLAVTALAVPLLWGLAATRAHAQMSHPPGTSQQQLPPADRPDQTTAPDDDSPDDDDGSGDDGSDDDDSGGHDGSPPGDNGGGGALDGTLDTINPVPDPSDGTDDREGPADLVEELPKVTSTYVSGTTARMRIDGKAAIPRDAPKSVRTLISQINQIVGKRYKWGGGHAKLVDRGYDCSGAVSYGLIKTGLLRSALVSGRFARWGKSGTGRWVTIYANKGHVYMEVAGLRLDTSAVGDDRARRGVRWRPAIGKRSGFTVRHPAGL